MSEEKPSNKTLGVKKAPKFELPKAPVPPDSETPNGERGRERVFGIEEAPTFFPTAEEFLDPYEYIGHIRPVAEKYGMCKIIPPASWSPPFSLDSETFHFSTKDNRGIPKQTAAVADEEYIQELCKFHSKQGQPIHKLPQLDHKPVDLLILKNEVALRGGFQNVSSPCLTLLVWTQRNNPSLSLLSAPQVTVEKKWAEIGRTMNYSRKTCTSLSNSLKTIYSRFVLPFELHMSTSTRADKEPRLAYDDVDDESELSSAGPLFDSESDDGHGDRNTESSFPSSPVTPTPAQNGFSKPPKAQSSKSDPSSIACEICRKDQNEEALLLCDGCDRGYHMYCLSPPLKVVPKTDWFCPNCIAQVDSITSEVHARYSLQLFQKKAQKFKEEIFSSMRTGDSSKAVTEDLTEELFWKLVDAGYDDLDVECGSDLSSALYGSGFPTIERNPREKYSLDKWNPNILPTLPDCLFSSIDTHVPELVVPRLNVGMCFSSFSWRYEPYYAYGIDFLHWGDSKTWYCVPASDARRFEEVVREVVPDLSTQEPEFPLRLATMVSPETLKSHGIKVTAVNQRAGQLVVTFPQACHAEFCHGFNFGENVNFALSDWPQHVLQYLNRSRALRKEPAFSYDGLMVALASNEPSIKTAVWLHAPLKEVVDQEIANRNALRSRCPDMKEEVDPGLPVTRCSHCKELNRLSTLSCSCTIKVTCPAHGEHVSFFATKEVVEQCNVNVNLCECPPDARVLRIRHSDEELQRMVSEVTDKAELPSRWVRKFHESVASLKLPSLNTLKHLLNDAEKIPVFINEAAFLKIFVNRANEWVEKANSFLGKKHRRGSTRPNIPSEEHVRGLFTEVLKLNFHSPEILSLEQLLQVIDTFKAEAHAALADPGMTIDQLRQLYQSGISVNVQMEELPKLMNCIRTMEWNELASCDSPTDLSKVEQMLHMASDYDIDVDDSSLKRLKHLQARGQRWKQSAVAILDQDMITSAELEALIELARESPHVPSLLSQAESLLSKVQDWSVSARALLGRGENPDILQRPTVDELHQMLGRLKEIPNKPVEVYILEHEQELTDKWCAAVKKAFLKVQTPKGWDEVLEVLQQNVSKCSAVESQGEAYCLCRSADSGFMIECDSCHEWYHGHCVKLTRKDAKSQRSYICPICNPAVGISRVFKRPTLEDLYKLIRESSQFKFIPREREILLSLTDDASSLRLQIRRFLATLNTTPSPSITQIQHYLRKVEGMMIHLPAETAQLRQIQSAYELPINHELDSASEESGYSS
ncbi:hypothetical protein K493DRAFT_301594 [Basidiobolus meristosporus CBS 931.73]|uniref:JmjC-domain-containing protein n=1 Tax=Basidiobolus meristosporus CBS 931.73 TaxID=1314790 RepID=A0A1Y1YBB5_9FUNG|nr:hypothetical protein K493DRAFT_301594 [Basidiobolus meristosporus CBS 931.73]|eukprot:ORX95233.1 hypothetical protein K493DRAFT_301594 [Basidiobolus meristosporus CBS 931.73]